MMKTIGIDPGLAGTGVGIVKGIGFQVDCFSFCSISTSKQDTLPNRLNQIYNALVDILNREKPDCMVMEEVFSLAKYPKSGIELGKVAGVILLAGQQAGIPIAEVSVREAKQILTGNGNASKKQFEKTVRHLLNLENPIRPYHASDAIGLALIGMIRFHQRSGAGDAPRFKSGAP